MHLIHGLNVNPFGARFFSKQDHHDQSDRVMIIPDKYKSVRIWGWEYHMKLFIIGKSISYHCWKNKALAVKFDIHRIVVREKTMETFITGRVGQ